MGMIDLLPAEFQDRARRIEGYRQLYAGEHREYFIDAGRSQFRYRAVERGGKAYFTPCDLLGLIARKTADLLFGEAPRVRHADPVIADKLAAVMDRSSLHGELLSVAVECSWAGESYLEVLQVQGEAYLQHASATEIFPVGSPTPDGQHSRYERFAVALVKIEGRPVTLILQTTYTAGAIERRCYELAGSERKMLPLSRWPAKLPDGRDLPERETTGLPRVTLVRFRNGAAAESDYTRQIIDAQDLLNAKQTQLSYIMYRHARPRLFLLASDAPQDGELRDEDEVLYGSSPEAMPKFVTWESGTEPAMKDRDFARQMLLTIAEMPAAFLGIKDDSTAESASKMRLNAMNAIQKAQRRAAYVVGPMKLALALALRLELADVSPGEITVQIRDGIPDDERERADVIATLRAAGAMSLRRALSMQQMEDAEVEKELGELSAERAQQTPSVLLGEPQADVPPAGTDESIAA